MAWLKGSWPARHKLTASSARADIREFSRLAAAQKRILSQGIEAVAGDQAAGGFSPRYGKAAQAEATQVLDGAGPATNWEISFLSSCCG